MTPSEWIAALSIVGTAIAGSIAWATYIAWLGSSINTNLLTLQKDWTEHKQLNATDHQELWRVVHKLAEVSHSHEHRLSLLEKHNYRGD